MGGVRASGIRGGYLRRCAEEVAEENGDRGDSGHGDVPLHDDGCVLGAGEGLEAGLQLVRVQRGAPAHHLHLCSVPFRTEYRDAALRGKPAAPQRD